MNDISTLSLSVLVVRTRGREVAGSNPGKDSGIIPLGMVLTLFFPVKTGEFRPTYKLLINKNNNYLLELLLISHY